MEARIMTDLGFGEYRAVSFKFANDLQTGRAAGRNLTDRLESFSSYQTKITINITNRQVEQESGQAVINFPNDHPMKAIGAFGFVSIHDVNAGGHQRQQSS